MFSDDAHVVEGVDVAPNSAVVAVVYIIGVTDVVDVKGACSATGLTVVVCFFAVVYVDDVLVVSNDFRLTQ